MSVFDEDKAFHFRLIDVDDAPPLTPVYGWEESSLSTLRDACNRLPLKHALKHVRAAEEMSTDFLLFHPTFLSDLGFSEEFRAGVVGAIHLYTQDWDESLFRSLNHTLRNRIRENVKPYFPYIKYLMAGFFLLPGILNGTIVYRGAQCDLSSKYPVGRKFRWWGFSSAIENPDLLAPLLQSSPALTVFAITCKSGLPIKVYSSTGSDEILLPFGTEYIVRNVSKPSEHSSLIEIEQISDPFISEDDDLQAVGDDLWRKILNIRENFNGQVHPKVESAVQNVIVPTEPIMDNQKGLETEPASKFKPEPEPEAPIQPLPSTPPSSPTANLESPDEAISSSVAPFSSLISKVAIPGFEMLNQGKVAEAFQYFNEHASEKVDCVAGAGLCYLHGLGAHVSEATAIVWFRAAQEGGSALGKVLLCWKEKKYEDMLPPLLSLAKEECSVAQWLLGLVYDEGMGVDKNRDEAFRYYSLAANQGFPRSLNALGYCYQCGVGVEKNLSKAVQYFQTAADRGDPAGLYNLGVCYENGDGVEKDEEKAVKYYELSADQGYVCGQTSLADCYRKGVGTQANPKLAAKYFHLSASEGDVSAQYHLGRCYETGAGLEKDLTAACWWYRTAADQGDAEAQYSLACHFRKGDGVERSIEAALYYFNLAASQGHARSQFTLGQLLLAGQEVLQDYERALKYLEAAAQQDHPSSLYLLGCIYEGGYGVQADLQKAHSFFDKAASLGLDEAKRKLSNYPETDRKRKRDE